jgi:hypothetical protein
MKKVLLTVGFFSFLSMISTQSAIATTYTLTDIKNDPSYPATARHVQRFWETSGHKVIEGKVDEWLALVVPTLGFYTGSILAGDYVKQGDELIAKTSSTHDEIHADLRSPTSPKFTPAKERGKSFRDRISEFSTLQTDLEGLQKYMSDATFAERLFVQAIETARRLRDEKQIEMNKAQALLSLSKASMGLETGVTLDARAQELRALPSKTLKQTQELTTYEAALQVLGVETYSVVARSSDVAQSAYERLQKEAKEAEEALRKAQFDNEKRLRDMDGEKARIEEKTSALNTLAEQIRYKLIKVRGEVLELKAKGTPTPKNATSIATRIDEMKDAIGQLGRAKLSLQGNTLKKGKMFGSKFTENGLTEELAKEILSLIR